MRARGAAMAEEARAKGVQCGFVLFISWFSSDLHVYSVFLGPALDIVRNSNLVSMVDH